MRDGYFCGCTFCAKPCLLRAFRSSTKHSNREWLLFAATLFSYVFITRSYYSPSFRSCMRVGKRKTKARSDQDHHDQEEHEQIKWIGIGYRAEQKTHLFELEKRKKDLCAITIYLTVFLLALLMVFFGWEAFLLDHKHCERRTGGGVCHLGFTDLAPFLVVFYLLTLFHDGHVQVASSLPHDTMYSYLS